MSPHEAGFTELGLFVETSLLGSKFKGGKLLERQPEMDMVTLQGVCVRRLSKLFHGSSGVVKENAVVLVFI